MQKFSSPKVSIIMSVHNGSSYLEESISSILDQTFSDFEFIIVNDASSDNSAQIIHRFKDSRIRYIENKAKIGLAASLNKAIDLSNGQYIARMDADDISLPSRIEQQVKFLDETPGIEIVSTFIEYLVPGTTVRAIWREDRENLYHHDILKSMPLSNCFAHPAVMMRRSILGEYKYNPSFKNSQDWDLWLRLLQAGIRFGKIPECLLLYRIHSGSVTSQNSKLYKRRIIFRIKFLFFNLVSPNNDEITFKVFNELIKDLIKVALGRVEFTLQLIQRFYV